MAEQGVSERAVVHERGEGSALWMLGGLYDVLLSSDETGGKASVMEFTIPAGMGPPPHRHAQDEIVYILEGTARYHIAGETRTVGAGAVVFLPRGTAETFEPTSTVRMITVYLPGGMDKFFSEFGEPATRREIPPPPDGPPDVEQLVALGARYGLTLEPPPA